ncbi:MAG: DNA polymerase I [Clostridia bacterium]|nr:DNA polymerase I [Clostridia bacterium]
MKTILVLDASSLFHRAFYGIRPLTTRTGLPTNAVFGYINIVKKHLDRVKPDYAVAAFDLSAPTFRHRMDPEYKATRKPMPEELRAQLPYLRRATEALGVAIVEKEGYEADDILGTLSRLAEESGNRAVLVTGDRDSFQLVSDGVTLILAGTNKDEEITPAVLLERFGLAPHQLIDVKALAGDTSDNIPGVRGIGEKSAVKLIAACKSLDGVYENTDALPVGPAAKEKLQAGKEDAYRSRDLARICRTVPALCGIECYPYDGHRPEILAPLLVELEFSRMLKTFGLEESAPAPVKKETAPEASGQGSIFDLIPSAETAPVEDVDAGSVAEDPLFLLPKDNDFFVLSKGKPCRLVGDVEGFLRSARPVLLDYKQYLHQVGDRFGRIRGIEAAFDLSLGAYTANSRDSSMTLSRLALTYLKENTVPDPERDPAVALDLMARLYPEVQNALRESGAEALFYEIELPLAYVLAKMERTGFAVSREGIEEYGKGLRQAAEAFKQEIYELAGEEFTIGSPKQLGRILFEKLGLPAGKKTKTGYATDAETLSALRFHSPIVDRVLAWRGVTKLESTYVEGMLSQIDSDGRIRTVFKQNLTATGRLSSAEPNLQNIPVKTELGREMRRFFTAKEKGYLLVDADYSQIELRLLAHMSGDEVLRDYFRQGRDIHTKTASEIFHVPEQAVTPEMRKSAKAVNFGIVYGIGEYSLSRDLGVPIGVARDYIRAYFELFPGIRGYLDSVKARAKEDGFVTTLFGRRRYIPELSATKKNLVAFGERVAQNSPIQGTAADIIKLAMVRVDRRLEREGLESKLVLQVHDELILEAPEAEAEYAARLLSEEMEGVVDYAVPLTAEAKVGFSWYDAK